MKLLRVEKDRYVFRMLQRDRNLLEIVLRLYPVIPPAHHQLSKSSTADKEHQQLLEAALAEQRAENKKLVADWLSNPDRYQKTGRGTEMTLTAVEINWLLQVLNDVHVGNWVLLGSPEQRPRFSPTNENARFVIAMDLACMFQSILLEALNPDS